MAQVTVYLPKDAKLIINEGSEVHIGQLIAQSPAVVISPVNGNIGKITKEAVVIDFNGTIIFAKRGIGKQKRGKLAILSKENEEVLLSDIKEECRGKVLVGGLFSREVLSKAFSLGAVSAVATSIEERDFHYFVTFTMLEASIFVIAKADFSILYQNNGKEAVTEGAFKRILIMT